MPKGKPKATLPSLARVLGATGGVSLQCLTLYIPDRDCDGHEIGNQRQWVLRAAQLLASIGGGVTIMPPAEGGWMKPDGEIVWENPVVVYTFIRPDEFVANASNLRRYLNELGRETNQGEVVVEFDGTFYRIVDFVDD